MSITDEATRGIENYIDQVKLHYNDNQEIEFITEIQVIELTVSKKLYDTLLNSKDKFKNNIKTIIYNVYGSYDIPLNRFHIEYYRNNKIMIIY